MDGFLKFVAFFGTALAVSLLFGQWLGGWTLIVAIVAGNIAYFWYKSKRANSFRSSSAATLPVTQLPVTYSTWIDPRDGQEYRVVRLRDGKQWFTESLRFASSESEPPQPIAYVTAKHDSPRPGRTYRFEDAVQSCPPGWHVPTYAEWTAMLTAYGPIETKEWMGSSKLRSQTVQLLAADGFNPVGAGRLWVATGPASVFGKPAAMKIKGSGGETADVAYFVCFTDNVYVHAESIHSLYLVRCVED